MHESMLVGRSNGLATYRSNVECALREVLSEYRLTIPELAQILGQMVSSSGERVTPSILKAVLGSVRIIERPDFFYVLLYVVFDRPEFDPRNIPDRAWSPREDDVSLRTRAWNSRMVADWRRLHAEAIAKIRRQVQKSKIIGGRDYQAKKFRGRAYQEWALHRAKILRAWRSANKRQYPTMKSFEVALDINPFQLESILRLDHPNILTDLVVYAKIWYLTGLAEFNPAGIIDLDNRSRSTGGINVHNRQWVQEVWDRWVVNYPHRHGLPDIGVGYNPFVHVPVSQPEKLKPVAVQEEEPPIVAVATEDQTDIALVFTEQQEILRSAAELLRQFAAKLLEVEQTLNELKSCGIPGLSAKVVDIVRSI